MPLQFAFYSLHIKLSSILAFLIHNFYYVFRHSKSYRHDFETEPLASLSRGGLGGNPSHCQQVPLPVPSPPPECTARNSCGCEEGGGGDLFFSSRAGLPNAVGQSSSILTAPRSSSSAFQGGNGGCGSSVDSGTPQVDPLGCGLWRL
ncbi:hypothetical protein SEVIR_8G132601v4 [Setaria viridis]